MKKTLRIYIFSTLIIMFVLSELGFRIYMNEIENERYDALQNHGQQSAQLMQEELLRTLYVVDVLRMVVELVNYDMSSFDQWAASIYNGEKSIGSVQLAPNGVVTYIYPLEGNEGAIGHNLLEDSRRNQGAQKTIDSDSLVLIGPVTLIQNNRKAIITRKSIYKTVEERKVFWGFAIIVFYIDDFNINRVIDSNEYYYRIIGDDPDASEPPVIYDDFPEYLDEYVDYPINLPNSQWHLQVALKKPYHPLKAHIFFWVLGSLISLLIIQYHYNIFKQGVEIQGLNSRLRELTYYDDLTGLLNRRGIYNVWQELEAKDKKAVALILADLNDFKSINDDYGHDIGDLSLQHFAYLLSSYESDDYAVGRLGGDEFLVILKSTDWMEKYLEDIQFNLNSKPVIVNESMSITLSAAFGMIEGTNKEPLDELLKKVDKAMYIDKNS